MTYLQLTYLHLLTVLPPFFIGAYLLLSKKGTSIHKFLGKIYMVLIFFTAIVSMFLSAKVGPAFLGHFGFIHLLSILVIVSVPMSLLAVRRGNIRDHKKSMVGVYVGGILIAGTFAFSSGRFLHEFVTNLF